MPLDSWRILKMHNFWFFPVVLSVAFQYLLNAGTVILPLFVLRNFFNEVVDIIEQRRIFLEVFVMIVDPVPHHIQHSKRKIQFKSDISGTSVPPFFQF